MRISGEEDAIAAFVANHGGTVPDGYYVVATCVMDLGFMLEDYDALWRVAFVPEDEENLIIGGTTTILGPDGQEFEFPNSMMVGGGNHEVAIEALTFIYLEGVADLVDPDDLVDAIGGILIETHRASAGLVEAARRGELSREVWERALPQAEVLVTDALTELAYIGPGMSKPVLDRFAASHPAASPTEIGEAIHGATIIGERALELTQHPHDRTSVLEELERDHPSVYPRIWPRLYFRAMHWWKWEI